MSELINKVGEMYKGNIVSRTLQEIIYRNNDLVLKVYDKENLVGFALEGNFEGERIYIVHDTDNYSRKNEKFSYIYDDAIRDTMHLVKVFNENKISIRLNVVKGFFRNKRKIIGSIPNESGTYTDYDKLTVNTTNFFES